MKILNKIFNKQNNVQPKMKTISEIREIVSKVLIADGYKISHPLMINEVAKNNDVIVASIKARGVADETDNRGYVISFGVLNMIKIIESNFKDFFLLTKEELKIFDVVVATIMTDYMWVWRDSSSIISIINKFNDLWEIGFLPITIWYRKDGDKVSIKHPLLTIANNINGFGWLVPYFETVILQNMWLPTTVASNAERYFNIIESFAKETSDNTAMVPYQLHNFSARGATDTYSSVITDIAHRYYFSSSDAFFSDIMHNNMILDEGTKINKASTVYATEHSIMMLGKKENEYETYKKLINSIQFEDGIISLVIDTWNMNDFIKTLDNQNSDLVTAIKKRAKKTVFRPDSGLPIEVIFGTKERLGLLQTLSKTFGETIIVNNGRQYKLLNNVGIIFGEGMSPQTVTDILQKAKDLGFSSDNFVFGIGAYAYQYITRDTYGIAFKLVSSKDSIEDNYYDLSKTPIDSEFKKELGGIYYSDNFDKLVKVDRPSELTPRDSRFKKYVMS